MARAARQQPNGNGERTRRKDPPRRAAPRPVVCDVAEHLPITDAERALFDEFLAPLVARILREGS